MSTDLQAQVRLDAVVRPLGLSVGVCRPEGEMGELRPSFLILDLDQLGSDGAERWVTRAGDQARVLGFYSHIDRELGETAALLGVETFRRGRFWKQLPEELQKA